MEKRPFFTLFIVAICMWYLPANAQTIAIKAGHIFNVNTGKFEQNKTIYIKAKHIAGITDGFKDVHADSVIDLSDQWLMPGLIDMHVHLENEFTKGAYLNDFVLNSADKAYDAAVFAKRTLLAGFTTVRDLGGTGVNTALARAVAAGKVIGPRIYSAGRAIGTTGSHADPTDGYRDDLMGDPGPREGVINSRAEARKAVRQRYKNGADVIKITATGGVLSLAKNGMAPQFTMEELKGIVEAAADLGMVTAAHAHGAEGMKRAVLAGINSIEHGSLMTEEVMDLMVEHGTYYVPTLMAGVEVVEKAKIKGYYPDVVVPKALWIGKQMQGTFAKAYKKGVKIAFGTDSGVSPHGENAKEFQYMVEAGMSPVDAIKSATLEAARLLRMDHELGQLAPGYYADIVAVTENPLKNIKVLQQVNFVMKEGKVYK